MKAYSDPFYPREYEIEDEQKEMNELQYRVEELEKENADLKQQLKYAKDKWLAKCAECSALKDKLDSIRYLEWDEVAKALKTPDGEWLDELFDEDDGWGALVTAVCSLAIPEQKYLDKAEVENLLYIMQDDTKAERLGYFKRALDAICSLAIPEQKYLDRAEVEKIIDTIKVSCFTGLPTEDEIQRASFEICSLAIVDKEKIESYKEFMSLSREDKIKAIKGE